MILLVLICTEDLRSPCAGYSTCDCGRHELLHRGCTVELAGECETISSDTISGKSEGRLVYTLYTHDMGR